MTKDKSEYIKNWLFRANEDIAVIKSLSGLDLEYYTSTICFHAQQAVEKYLKAFLIYHDVDFPKTHDVDFLIMECQKIDQHSFEIDLKSLTDYGVSIRYPDDFYIPGITETKEYMIIAKEIKSLVENLIKL
ncbi:MAG: HEPN domain-containing protein [Bacteroidales bacterium]|nr:HEPN domain-containing protein [Bacteroidales bacterium]